MVQPLSAVQVERLIAVLRLFGLVAGVVLISLSDFPNDVLFALAWTTMGVLAVASVPIWVWGRRTDWSLPGLVHAGFVLDVLLILGYAVSFSFIRPNVSWCVAFTVLADATIRYGLRGAMLGLVLSAVVFTVQAEVHQAATGEHTAPVGYAFVLSTLVGVAGVLGVFTRLLARRDSEHQDQALALADALEVQARGIASVAHEVRGALAVIVGAASTARQKRDRLDDAGLAGLLEDVEHQGRHLEQLLEDALTNRPDHPGALPVRPRQDDVATTIRRAIDASALHRRGHPLHLELPSLVCTLDHERLQQVVRNLVDNAYQHTDPGTRVTVSARRLGVMVEVLVADHGPGIPMAAQARALDPFSRRTDQPATGGGLGLYLVRQIVIAMGGVVETRSLGEGTQVTFRVPATRFATARHPGA